MASRSNRLELQLTAVLIAEGVSPLYPCEEEAVSAELKLRTML